MPRTRFVIFTAAAIVVAACSSRDDERAGEALQSLTRAELPRAADLHYDVTQPATGGSWKLDAVIRPIGDGRRIELTKRSDASVTTAAFAADRRGAIERSLDGASPWARFEALSVPSEVIAGREWKPFNGARYDEPGTAAVIDSTRTYRVVSVNDTNAGTLYRAVFNVRPHVVRSVYEDGSWPFANDVQGVGIAEYFVPRGTTSSFLVANAEYRFLMAARPASLAIASQSELRARVADASTFLTLTCLREGAPAALEAKSTRPEIDRGLGLEECDGTR